SCCVGGHRAAGPWIGDPARPRVLTLEREVWMRIALSALAAPYLQNAEGPSLPLGTAGGDTLSVVPDTDGALVASSTLTPRQATADGTNAEGDWDGHVWHVDVP